LHCNLYIPLEFILAGQNPRRVVAPIEEKEEEEEFILFSGILQHNWLYIELHARNTLFKSVLLNELLTMCMSGL
jgi:hypothetical protein